MEWISHISLYRKSFHILSLGVLLTPFTCVVSPVKCFSTTTHTQGIQALTILSPQSSIRQVNPNLQCIENEKIKDLVQSHEALGFADIQVPKWF